MFSFLARWFESEDNRLVDLLSLPPNILCTPFIIWFLKINNEIKLRGILIFHNWNVIEIYTLIFAKYCNSVLQLHFESHSLKRYVAASSYRLIKKKIIRSCFFFLINVQRNTFRKTHCGNWKGRKSVVDWYPILVQYVVSSYFWNALLCYYTCSICLQIKSPQHRYKIRKLIFQCS